MYRTSPSWRCSMVEDFLTLLVYYGGSCTALQHLNLRNCRKVEDIFSRSHLLPPPLALQSQLGWLLDSCSLCIE